MSTRADIIKKNKDGTFDTRYHHWDGHIDSLGEFLHTYFNSPQKVNWLFDIKRPFSSIMGSLKFEVDLQDVNRRKNIVQYGDEFGDLKNDICIIAYINESDASKRADFQTMKEICDQEYQYFYDEEKNKWSVVVNFNDNFKNSDLIEVESFLNLYKLASSLVKGQDKNEVISQFSTDEFNNLLSLWNESQKSQDRIIFMKSEFESIAWREGLELEFKDMEIILSSIFDEKALRENIKPTNLKSKKILKI